MRFRTMLPVVVLAAVGLGGCEATPTELGDLEGDNVVAVGIQQNSFAFAVRARDLTLDQSYELSFDEGHAQLGLSVAGYSGGSARLELLDSDGGMIYSRTLTANTAEGHADLAIRPARARLRFSAYTGTVAVGLDGD